MEKINFRNVVFNLLIVSIGIIIGYAVAVRSFTEDFIQCKSNTECHIPGLDTITMESLQLVHTASLWVVTGGAILAVLFYLTRPYIGLAIRK
jgi:hypothetical protein